jgi:hypothetical protein
MTKPRVCWQTYLRGRRLMEDETVLRAWESGGFHLDRSGIADRQCLTRLPRGWRSPRSGDRVWGGGQARLLAAD